MNDLTINLNSIIKETGYYELTNSNKKEIINYICKKYGKGVKKEAKKLVEEYITNNSEEE